MKLGMIHSVGVSKKGKSYGTLASGAIVFPRTKDGVVTKGKWVIYSETFQTQDAEGKDLDTPVPVNVIASDWDNKNEAIKAFAEPQLLDAEVAAFIGKETRRISKEFSLEAAAETA